MLRTLLGLMFNDSRRASSYRKRIKKFGKNILSGMRRRKDRGKPIADLSRYEQQFYSQNGEDGILRTIFERIGETNRHCVEFGIHREEGNTIYLREQGWNCLWMDGNGDGEEIKAEIITAENINQLLSKYHVPADLDLLSIDIDSNDYWVWNAIDAFTPRVVVIEYNATIPVTQSLVRPYDPQAQWDGTNFYGASLRALYTLGEKKGYTLIGCDSVAVNAFFIRNDLVGNHFVVQPLEQLYRPSTFGKKVDGKFTGHGPSDRTMIPV